MEINGVRYGEHLSTVTRVVKDDIIMLGDLRYRVLGTMTDPEHDLRVLYRLSCLSEPDEGTLVVSLPCVKMLIAYHPVASH